MSNNLPLLHDSIVLTGTSITRNAQSRIEELGGSAIHLPLIETVEISGLEDLHYLQQSQRVDWLIFTSQNAVYAFLHKMKQYQMGVSDWTNKIAVVGKKTADSLIDVGFDVDFMPTIFSADVMVKEFNPLLTVDNSCLFIRGALAKNTIVEGLKSKIQTWTIYDTIATTKSINQMRIVIQQKRCTIVFASPSAVEVYAKEILPNISWASVDVAAIGHITYEALQDVGATNIIQPSEYTMAAVIEEIANRKEL